MNENPLDKALFLNQAVEIFPADFEKIQSCLILAPHPDDESLGCGGLIATLRTKDVKVSVVVTTDGSQSHPHSTAFPPERLKVVRKEEVTKALDILGVGEDKLFFFDGRDTALPCKGEKDFEYFLQKIAAVIEEIQPDLILVPYELDPHCDHRATWSLLHEALKDRVSIKVWQYPIWLYELAAPEDVPQLKTGELKKLNIREFLKQKKQAIACHTSQTTRMIDDDPTGFILTDDMIAHFTTSFEYFIERK